MRILAVALVLTSLCGLPLRAQGVDPGVREKVLAARSEAIKVIQEYSQNPSYDENNRNVAARMANLLIKAGIGPAVNKTLSKCNADPGMVAGTDLGNQNIWLCAFAFSRSHGVLVQAFIHESYHLYEGRDYYHIYKPSLYNKFMSNGFSMTTAETDDSEKRAAKIEFEITTKTFGCVYFKTGYFRRLLDLEQNRDYVFCKQ